MSSTGRLRVGAVFTVALVATLSCGGGQSSSGQASPAPHCAAAAGLTQPVNDKGTASLGSIRTILVGDEFFSPTCITGASGTVTLTFRNDGRLLHNFSVPDQNIDVDVAPGQTVTVKVTVGSKPVGCFCKYHRDAGQKCALLPST